MEEFMGRPRFARGENGNGNGVHMEANGTPVEEKGHAELEGVEDTQSRRLEDSPSDVEKEGAKTDAGSDIAVVRDRLGRFQLDNPGGPGNPFGRYVARNRKILLAAISEEEFLALIRTLQSMAMERDLGAIKTLMQFLVGKPVPVPNPDRVFHEEWEMRMEQPNAEQVMVQENQLPHPVVLRTHRVLDVTKCEGMYRDFQAGQAERDAAEAKQAARAERRARRKEERQRRKNGG